MEETIKKALFAQYRPDDTKGLFISLFDAQNVLLASNGVVETSKNLEQLVELLYKGLMDQQKSAKVAVIDVVTESKQENDTQEIISLPIQQYGVCLVNPDNNKSGVVLPNTAGVSDMKHALQLIKEKYGLTGNVTIFVFKTNRIVIPL